MIIPARDEAAHLPACLESVELAARESGRPTTVVVVLDSCRDDSAAVVARSKVQVTTVSIEAGSVGVARGVGAAHLLAHNGSRDLWLATTDADSTVSRHWLSRQLRHASSGADVVAGTVVVASWTGWGAERRRSYEDSYALQLEPDGHGHVHGANLGIRATTYQRIGGFPPVARDEDVSLVRAAREAGAVIAWATDLPVRTSARADGRAPSGFAETLQRFLPASLVEA